MFGLFVGLSAGFGVLSLIFIYFFLKLSFSMRKAIYISHADVVVMFHGYHQLADLKQNTIFIDGNKANSYSFIFVPGMFACTIAAAKTTPDEILIKENVTDSLNLSLIIFRGSKIIKA